MELVEHLGIKIPIDPSIVPDNIAEFIRNGRYETREGRLLQKTIEPGDRVLELGGGLGFISAIAGKNANVEQVLVFEANPILMPAIQRTHDENGVTGVDVRNGVVFSNPDVERVPFFVRKQFWGSSLVQRDGESEADAVEIPVRAMADVIQEFQPSMIVMDIEGGEASLFDGSDLPGVQKIMMEVHQQHIGGKAMADLFCHLAQSGFHYDQNDSAGAVILFRRY
jgi:FkbM family methyltransferase